MALLHQYRKRFCEYQKFAEEDADKREVQRLEGILDALRRENEEREKEILAQKESAQTSRLKREQQEKELFQIGEKEQQEENRQQQLWKEKCQELGLPEEKMKELMEQEFRTQQEITDSLDKKLDRIEQILAGYIIQEKKQMDKITAIIDDPGGR